MNSAGMVPPPKVQIDRMSVCTEGEEHSKDAIMALTTQSKVQERIPLVNGNSATPEEIQKVWMLISMNRTIRVRQIAATMKSGTSKAHGIITFLKQCGYIANKDHRYAWDVLIPFVGVEK